MLRGNMLLVRATCCLKQHVARNKQHVACCRQQNCCADEQHVSGDKQLVAGNKQLVARNMLRWCKCGFRELFYEDGEMVAPAGYREQVQLTQGVSQLSE